MSKKPSSIDQRHVSLLMCNLPVVFGLTFIRSRDYSGFVK